MNVLYLNYHCIPRQWWCVTFAHTQENERRRRTCRFSTTFAIYELAKILENRENCVARCVQPTETQQARIRTQTHTTTTATLLLVCFSSSHYTSHTIIHYFTIIYTSILFILFIFAHFVHTIHYIHFFHYIIHIIYHQLYYSSIIPHINNTFDDSY